jgi:hypothetical protein
MTTVASDEAVYPSSIRTASAACNHLAAAVEHRLELRHHMMSLLRQFCYMLYPVTLRYNGWRNYSGCQLVRILIQYSFSVSAAYPSQCSISDTLNEHFVHPTNLIYSFHFFTRMDASRWSYAEQPLFYPFPYNLKLKLHSFDLLWNVDLAWICCTVSFRTCRKLWTCCTTCIVLTVLTPLVRFVVDLPYNLLYNKSKKWSLSFSQHSSSQYS